MIRLHKLMFLSGLDWNGEVQNWCLLRISPEGYYVSRQTRFLAGHSVFAFDQFSEMRCCPLEQRQSQGFLLLGSMLCHSFRAVDVSGFFARYRGQFACASRSTVPHGISLFDDFPHCTWPAKTYPVRLFWPTTLRSSQRWSMHFTSNAGRSNCSSNGSKQHLRIRASLGTSENAVRTKIWIAVSTYVLITIVKKRLHLAGSLYEILQIPNPTIF